MAKATEPAGGPDDNAPRRSRFLRRPSRERVVGWLAAAAGALMVVLAFPTVDLAFPIALALVPVLVRARALSWRQRLRLGWLMGFLYHVVLFRWLPFTLTEMTPIPLPVAWLMWWLYAAWHGLVIGVFLALAEPVRRLVAARAPALAAIAVALVFVAVEHLFPAMFPFSLGHAFGATPPVAALQALGGVPLLALFAALVQAALADAWTRDLRSARAAGVALVVLAAAGAAWFVHADGAEPTRTLRVAVVQPNYTLAEKKKASVAQRQRLLDRFEAQIRALPRGRFDLVVASEGAFPLYWDVRAEEHPSSRALASVATLRMGIAVAEGPACDTIIGGLRQGEALAPHKPPTHNAAVLVGGDGKVRAHYDKRVLVPFSEYLPLSDLIPSLRGAIPGIGDFTPGEAPCRFDAAGTRVACGICYETMFQDETREAAQDDARLLVNLTIDTWFGRTVAPRMHLMAHASRAVELGLPLVRAALTGITAVVSPTGEVVASLPMDEPGVLAADVPLTELVTPFRVTGPIVPWVAVGLSLVLLALAFRARRELFPPGAVRASRSTCSSSSDAPSSPRPPSEGSPPTSPGGP
ncbi:MAG: apolipoprotein N-acyltransferase [Deltaproteobacteria bacterium]|nr:apolipoprotein N-acyltransferase [Deltaproteobacteria bacterium]